MRALLLGSLSLLAAGCAPATDGWFVDTWWLEPVAEGGASGLLTRQVLDGRWDRRQLPRHHVCATVYAVAGTPGAGCDACEVAWSVSTQALDSDCGLEVEPGPPPTAVGLGALDAEIAGSEPYPTATAGSWARYDDGPWVAHGWAIRGGGEDASDGEHAWDGAHPVTAWPAWAVAGADLPS